MAASTLSDFTKLVLPASLLAGTVFSMLTAPLVMYGSEQVVVRFQDERVFDDRLKDIAAPYIGLAGLVSLSAGAACLGLMGWRQANRRSHAADSQISALHQQLQAKATQVEELLLTDTRLEAAGLGFFLPAADPVAPVQPPSKAQPVLPRSVPTVVIQTAAPVIDSLVFGTDALTPWQANTVANRQVQSVVSPLAAAQVFLGLSRVPQSAIPAPQPVQDEALKVLVGHGHGSVAESA